MTVWLTPQGAADHIQVGIDLTEFADMMRGAAEAS